MNAECLHNSLTAIILAKLTYAVCAWIGFTRTSDRQKHLYVDASVLDSAQWILPHLHSYVTLYTNNFLLEL